VETGDVIIGKRMQTSQLGNDRKKASITVDHSTILSASEPMRVSKVYLTTNSPRDPESRGGQRRRAPRARQAPRLARARDRRQVLFASRPEGR
jgi:hypothetical protein